MKTSFKIRVIFDRCKKASKEIEAPVEIEIYQNGKRRRFRTGVKVLKHQFRDGRVVNHPRAYDLNKIIEGKLGEANEYARLGMPERLSHERIVVPFTEWLENEVSQRKDITESTRASHNVLVEEVIRCGYFKSFRDLTPANLQRWDNRLREKEVAQSTIHSYHKRMKVYINRAISQGLIEKSPYVGMKVSRGRSQRGRKFLTLPQLKAIENLKLMGLEENVRRLFLLSCYTGLAYCDLMRIEKSKLRFEGDKVFLQDERWKTGTGYHILIRPKAKAILEGFKWELPDITNQVCNRALKYVALAAEIPLHLTMHVGRHTFATLALSQGVSIEVVSKMLAHTDIKTTQIYAKVLQEDVDRGFEMLDF